ncbi:uncharacterized protein FTJAE_3364 [Fusarium tjaetaba]|uniref:Uncharacterized protein n=1 Tax=Fusarium tjaetaba TaxID=1567544 RepID=A0A8H5S1M5_9HYPO|nr:uncharacterized protein FTJAE_3364 [Fusarium tjaetaba]KAF5643004.1 hypothetical protein FTJAE_3364 [Fusarium tjaetaba]
MAEVVMQDSTWKIAIDYVNQNKSTSTSEAVSNGVWNEILRRNFPFPKFIIAPEQRQTTRKRPDLTIFFVDKTKKEWHPVFTFEGKAPYHISKDSTIQGGIAQAAGYVPSLSWSNHEEKHKNEKSTHGMFACGKSFMILKYDVDNKTVSRVVPQKEEETSDDLETCSSLDQDAKGFDAFCKRIADSFH